MQQPAAIYVNYLTIAQQKVSARWYHTLVLAILAGSYIAFGAIVANLASATLSGSVASLVKGAVFPVGLILVVVCGAELFTGNNLLVAAACDRKIKVSQLCKNWGIVYGGNCIGAVIIALLVVYSNVQNAVAIDACVTAAANKSNLLWYEAIIRGILCNVLVCLAVWASMASKNIGGKIMALYLPILTFVVCGFEHSVANMYYLSAGLLTSARYGISLNGLSLGRALGNCLIPTTIGNLIGGTLIALAYYCVYHQPHKQTAAPTNHDNA